MAWISTRRSNLLSPLEQSIDWVKWTFWARIDDKNEPGREFSHETDSFTRITIHWMLEWPQSSELHQKGASFIGSMFYRLYDIAYRAYIRLNIRKLGLKETEQRILDDCGCSYGILMQLEEFRNFRQCDYYDEVRCVKHILQDHIFDRNRRSATKCLPPCKGVNFEADKVTVSQPK